MRFYFYDTETSGTDTRHDQVLQFARVTTGDDLEPAGSFEMRARPDRHVLPHPAALLVTGMRMSELSALPHSHYTMMGAVADDMAPTPDTVFIGHNLLRFDEEIMRHGYWKTLHDPYVTSRAGAGRMDTRAVMRLAHVLEKDAYAWREGFAGQPSFRLEHLCADNGIAGHNAHDAFGDVLAAAALMRLVRERTPAIWEMAVQAAFRSGVDRALATGKPMLVLTDGGPAEFRAVVPLARSPERRNEIIALDLDRGVEAAKATTPAAAVDELGAAGRGPFVLLRINRAPLLLPLSQIHGPDQVARYEVAAAAATADKMLVAQAIAVAQQRAHGREKGTGGPEEKLYDGFPSREDERRRDRFHQVPATLKDKVVAGFEDKRLQALGLRLIHLEWPEASDPARRERLEGRLLSRLFREEETPWLTRGRALAATDELLVQETVPARRAILEDYRAHLGAMEAPAPEIVRAPVEPVR